MKFTPRDHPMNWYRYDVAGSVELLDSYVSDVERQVEKNIADFATDREELVVEGMRPDEPPRFIAVHKGLDDGTWDLEAVFLEYFPNLQRRSALITLFSFFEHELNKLCTWFQETEKYQISYRDIAGSGIEKARTYLGKVAAIEFTESAAPWNEVKNVQLLRNLVVHADGRFPQERPGERSALRRYVDANEFLGGEGEILIRAGYLKHVLMSFKEYFEMLEKDIHCRYDKLRRSSQSESPA
ncbi:MULTISPECIES: hypothetical protein [Paraburkholderia]|uniref:hypothetical protein n=1 Tax=Paraburkholderia TaxID=1822464 RepID=UPI0038B73720